MDTIQKCEAATLEYIMTTQTVTPKSLNLENTEKTRDTNSARHDGDEDVTEVKNYTMQLKISSSRFRYNMLSFML